DGVTFAPKCHLPDSPHTYPAPCSTSPSDVNSRSVLDACCPIMYFGSRNECTPCCEGIRPVKKVARVGEHTGLQLKARVKRTPSVASRSIFGVPISGLPEQPSVHAP